MAITEKKTSFCYFSGQKCNSKQCIICCFDNLPKQFALKVTDSNNSIMSRSLLQRKE